EERRLYDVIMAAGLRSPLVFGRFACGAAGSRPVFCYAAATGLRSRAGLPDPEFLTPSPGFFMSNTPVRKPIEIKISTVVAVAAILHDTSMPSLQQAMAEMTGGAADYFDDEFAILDI